MADAPRGPAPLYELTLARLREMFREPATIFWAFGFPIVMALVLGIAFRNQGPSLPRVAIAPGAPEWVASALRGSERVEIVEPSDGTADAALARGSVDLIVRAPVPSGAAGAGGAHGDAGGVEYRYDESRAEGRLARLAADDVLQRARGRADALAVAEDAAPPPGSRYVDYLFPGVLGMNIMMSSLWGMGYAIVVGRKLKLLRRLAVTPMRRRDFLLSYFLSRALLLVVEALVILVFGALAFGVEMRGSLVALTVVSAAGAAAFAALALVVASRTDNLDAANGLLNAVALPMWMASGTFFSYERFPEIVHPLIRALPLTALNDALRAIANEGASLGSTWSELLVLAAWTVAGFLAASRLFRWQ